MAELRRERALVGTGRPVLRSALAGWRERAVLFASAYVVFAAIGLYTTLALGIVVGDAESRLAHAFFVWWNDPSKLTAVGFYWPPMQTLALLPLAAAAPLATSLAALPLTSAAFAAGLLAVIDHALARAGVERALRWALVAAFGLNPLILFYAGNGMAEVVYLFFLTLGLSVIVGWSTNPRWQALPIAGFAFGIGILARYELAAWLGIAIVAALAVHMRQRQAVPTLEASFLVLLVPAVYGITTWVFINWTLTGEALGFLSGQLVPKDGAATIVLPDLLAKTVFVQVAIFPAAAVVAGWLLWVGLRRRDPMGLALAASIAVAGAMTFVFVLRQQQEFLLQLRYNLRAMPVAMIGLAWLLGTLPAPRRRPAAVGSIALLVASGASTAALMLTFPQALGEAAFLRGLVTGQRYDGAAPPTGTGVSLAHQRDMARAIRRLAPGSNTVLTDDARNYGVMLFDGNPGRYLDRIDFGDPVWDAYVRRPVAPVRYILIERGATRGRDPVFFDRIVDRYPELANGVRPPSFLELAYENPSYALYRIVRPRTIRP